MSKFSFGANSEKELVGVNPKLVSVVRMALTLSPQDFAVHDGVRNEAEQAELVRTGASQRIDSKHRRQSDGFGHAVDLVPYVNGKLRWEWGPIYPIAEAMRRASVICGVPITWGGCWDINFRDSTGPVEKLVEQYVQRRKKLRRKAFIDGPHYELR
jgi:peptidoglycan L-alanyl-D-glutamate endopeptidase CwlK